MIISTITSKGQITIPKNLRDYMSLVAGDKVEFIINDDNEIVIKRCNDDVDSADDDNKLFSATTK